MKHCPPLTPQELADATGTGFWANAAAAAPRHSGFAPSRQGVSAIRRVSAFASDLLVILIITGSIVAAATFGGA